jgi:hypothetical protein
VYPFVIELDTQVRSVCIALVIVAAVVVVVGGGEFRNLETGLNENFRLWQSQFEQNEDSLVVWKTGH